MEIIVRQKSYQESQVAGSQEAMGARRQLDDQVRQEPWRGDQGRQCRRQGEVAEALISLWNAPRNRDALILAPPNLVVDGGADEDSSDLTTLQHLIHFLERVRIEPHRDNVRLQSPHHGRRLQHVVAYVTSCTQH